MAEPMRGEVPSKANERRFIWKCSKIRESCFRAATQAPQFYRRIGNESVTEFPQEKGSPGPMEKGIIKNLAGIKPEEIEWSGRNEWLARQKGSVTKEQVIDYLKANKLEVKEVVKGEQADRWEGNTLYVDNKKYGEIEDTDGRRYVFER